MGGTHVVGNDLWPPSVTGRLADRAGMRRKLETVPDCSRLVEDSYASREALGSGSRAHPHHLMKPPGGRDFV